MIFMLIVLTAAVAVAFLGGKARRPPVVQQLSLPVYLLSLMGRLTWWLVRTIFRTWLFALVFVAKEFRP